MIDCDVTLDRPMLYGCNGAYDAMRCYSHQLSASVAWTTSSSCASLVSPLSLIPDRKSVHRRISLPLFLLPSTISLSLLITISFSCIFFDISPTFVIPLIPPFLILSSFVTPRIQLSIPISATSNFISCAVLKPDQPLRPR